MISTLEDTLLVMVLRILLLLAENRGAPFPHREAAFLKMKEAGWRFEKYSPGVINLPKHRHLAAF